MVALEHISDGQSTLKNVHSIDLEMDELQTLRRQLEAEKDQVASLEVTLVEKAITKKTSLRKSSVFDAPENYEHDAESLVTEESAPDDLTQAGDNLNDAIIAQYLQERYAENKVYTYIGDILVALNPFKKLSIYDLSTAHHYMGQVSKDDLPPHIFFIANNAYRMMLVGGAPQVCVISGESGAGKTESTKLLIRQIIDCSAYGLDAPSHDDDNNNLDIERHLHPVEEKILQINPILESFGNAQTAMNDNSSRFGKYIELQLKSTGQVTGASIKHYLLEKARVCRQGQDEHNFHVFAQFLAGTDEKLRKYYRIESYSDYHYLPTWDGFDEFASADNLHRLKQEWQQQQQAMFQVGFTDAERDDASAALAGILHIGNIQFAPTAVGGSDVTPSSGNAVISSADAFCVDQDAMARVLTCGLISTRGETVETSYDSIKAANVRDSLAKTVYNRLFSWVVTRIDAILAAERSLSEENFVHLTKENEGSQYAIGILDIFGFEHFEVNGFDQILINLANEQLQLYFNKHIFEMEMEEYAKQELDESAYKDIKFDDNMPALLLFSARPLGLFAILDDQSKLSGSSPETLVQAFNKSLFEHLPFAATRDSVKFGVRHYAGLVTYTSNDFLLKNRDVLPDLVLDTCAESTNPLLRFLFTDFEHLGDALSKDRRGRSTMHGNKHNGGRRGKSQHGKSRVHKKRAKQTSVCANFMISLRQLMHRLNCSNPHFVRCIKPNQTSEANTFEAANVLRQMRYNGILATVNIRRKGFPHRLSYSAFVTKYKGLVMAHTEPLSKDREGVTRLLQKIEAKREASSRKPLFEEWVVGVSLVFMKHWHAEVLSDMGADEQTAALTLQSQFRMISERKRYRALLVRVHDDLAQISTFVVSVGIRSREVLSAQQALRDEEQRRGPVALGLVKRPARKRQPKRKMSAIDNKKFAKLLEKARKNVVKWWIKTERQKNHHIDDTGRVFSFFHGLISRHIAEEYLATAEGGTYLVRISERYHGYAISARVENRIKHYKLVVSPKTVAMAGTDVEFQNLRLLILHYETHALPSQEGEKDAFLVAPLFLVHDLGVGVDHDNNIIKGNKGAANDVSDFNEGLFVARESDQGVVDTTAAIEADDSVFDTETELAQGFRWMRMGMMTRDQAERELRERGLINGRFLVRLKTQMTSEISVAISYTFNNKFYHHILERVPGKPWVLDGTIAAVDGGPFWGPLESVIRAFQDRHAPQLAMALERDVSSIVVSGSLYKRDNNRYLLLVTPRTTDNSNNHGVTFADTHIVDNMGNNINNNHHHTNHTNHNHTNNNNNHHHHNTNNSNNNTTTNNHHHNNNTTTTNNNHHYNHNNNNSHHHHHHHHHTDINTTSKLSIMLGETTASGSTLGFDHSDIGNESDDDVLDIDVLLAKSNSANKHNNNNTNNNNSNNNDNNDNNNTAATTTTTDANNNNNNINNDNNNNDDSSRTSSSSADRTRKNRRKSDSANIHQHDVEDDRTNPDNFANINFNMSTAHNATNLNMGMGMGVRSISGVEQKMRSPQINLVDGDTCDPRDTTETREARETRDNEEKRLSREERRSLLNIPGLGVRKTSASPNFTPSPVSRRHHQSDQNSFSSRPQTNTPPIREETNTPREESDNSSAIFGFPEPKTFPKYDKKTGRRLTGVPRFYITEDSSVADVSKWLRSIGQPQYVSKFAKKKVDGFKLFVMTESKCRKLVKREDDFILFKRALRQAVAFADTIPTQGDMNRVEEWGEVGWRRVSEIQAPPKPYRSLHRNNPLFKQQQHHQHQRKHQHQRSLSPLQSSDSTTPDTSINHPLTQSSNDNAETTQMSIRGFDVASPDEL